jgi:hypothetical protein
MKDTAKPHRGIPRGNHPPRLNDRLIRKLSCETRKAILQIDDRRALTDR